MTFHHQLLGVAKLQKGMAPDRKGDVVSEKSSNALWSRSAGSERVGEFSTPAVALSWRQGWRCDDNVKEDSSDYRLVTRPVNRVG